jgi:hypothetical protein
MPGAFGALDFLAVHRDHLAEFGEILYYRVLQGPDAILGNDLTNHQAGRRDYGGRFAEAGTKACRGHQGALL